MRFNGARVPIARTLEGPLDAAVSGTSTLIAQVLRSLRSHIALYASGLSSNGAGLVIVAPSGAGKTTLTLEMLRRGWATFGDEFVLLGRATRMLSGIPLTFMVREPTFSRIADLRIERATRDGKMVRRNGGVRTWHGLDVVRAFGSRALATPAKLTHLVLFERGAATAIEPMPIVKAALELAAHLFSEQLEAEYIWDLASHLAGVRCWRLTARDHREAADMLEGLATGAVRHAVRAAS